MIDVNASTEDRKRGHMNRHGMTRVMLYTLLSALWAAGCDPVHTSSIEIIVPANVQSEYEDQSPVRLYFRAAATGFLKDWEDVSRGTALAVICEPGATVRATTVFAPLGAPTEADLFAWLASATDIEPGDAECGTVIPYDQQELRSINPVTPDAPRARAIAFEGRDETWDCCDSLSEQIEMVLALPTEADDGQ